MSTYSKLKGRLAEREVAEILTNHGFPAVRNERNSSGGEDISHSIPGVWIEVCRAERMNLNTKFLQAINAAQRDGNGRTPWLVHRKNREPWLVTLRLDDLLTCENLLALAEQQQSVYTVLMEKQL